MSRYSNPIFTGYVQICTVYPLLIDQVRASSDPHGFAGVSLRINSVQMLEINPWGIHNVLDVLRLINSLPPSLSLASVTVIRETLDHEALQLMISILQRHCRIICVLLDHCGSVERTHIDQAIIANRWKWKEDARNGGEFAYTVGCDHNAADSDDKDYFAFMIYQHEFFLSDCVDVFAMINIPRPGKITLKVSIKPEFRRIINLIATLTRSASSSVGEVGVTSDFSPTVRFNVDDPDSPGSNTVSVEGFPELGTGCYELRIQNNFVILFKNLTIDFTERPADKESEKSNSGSGEVEGARKVQEGEEADGGEDSSVEVKEAKSHLSSCEDTVELCPEPGNDSGQNRPIQEATSRLGGSDDGETEEDAQSNSGLGGSGRDVEDVDRTSNAQTEARGESFQPDNGVEPKKDRKNVVRRLQPTSSDERAGDSGSKPFTNSARDHKALEESPRPGSRLGYANKTKENEKGESTLVSPSRGVESVESDLSLTSHGHTEGNDGACSAM
ncbi:hypothetical protein PQX77_008989 [Marasmius sp. AFHP31]|nr:hypothetical protein PQX77_008989 [Marasmius sp. AFHP31]